MRTLGLMERMRPTQMTFVYRSASIPDAAASYGPELERTTSRPMGRTAAGTEVSVSPPCLLYRREACPAVGEIMISKAGLRTRQGPS